eukprot:335867-Chlamydomonas_euryale.AAC.7
MSELHCCSAPARGHDHAMTQGGVPLKLDSKSPCYSHPASAGHTGRHAFPAGTHYQQAPIASTHP